MSGAYFYAKPLANVAVKLFKPTSPDLLVMDTTAPIGSLKKAFAKWPEETVNIDGKAYSKGTWRHGPYTDADKKLIGFRWEGKWLSVHKEDRWGLESIQRLVRTQVRAYPYEFVNGEVIVLTPGNIDSFEVEFVKWSKSFFPSAEALLYLYCQQVGKPFNLLTPEEKSWFG